MDYCKIFSEIKSIAVIGISDKPYRDSGIIASLLLRKGYNVIGVNPRINKFEGIQMFRNISEINIHIDLVDVFINGNNLENIIEEIIKINPKYLWMQLGVYSEKAVQIAESNGIIVIKNKCVAIELRNCENFN
jgi:hypothetical protein